ncbi:MAG: 2-oxoacid:acceptor oxidoreductase family protein [Clostridiales bacterium]|jgi:2-oxoglutarate ferredoxin oxidoreductase subunit gamma|nr:2-oxoacid:acceptor oxidoreductase family protein [Clostridiales bacterium]
MRRILLAGFGGQGILFAGKFLAYIGMAQGKEVSWLPSYGPEMRGGTANCGVIISEEPIGSPIVSEPDILICMNQPSLDKFASALSGEGVLFLDNSIIERKAEALNARCIPATRLASDNGMSRLANMIMLGKVIAECALCDRAVVGETMRKAVPDAGKADLLRLNLRAIDIGWEY